MAINENFKMDYYAVEWTTLARSELKEIYQYIAEHSYEPIAAKLADTITKEADKLSYMAEGFRVVNKKRGYRRLIVKKNYNIYFTIDESTKTVYIRRVIYARRDLPRLLA